MIIEVAERLVGSGRTCEFCGKHNYQDGMMHFWLNMEELGKILKVSC